MEIDYSLEKGMLNGYQVDLLRSYYKNWVFEDSIQLKFRYIKVFGHNLDINQPQWIVLHRKTNKRRIYNDTLVQNIQTLIDYDFVPYRIFQSVAEWLSPNEIEKQQAHYMLKTGIIVLENDDSFEKSVQTAIEISREWNEDFRLIYSGNKSVHAWLSIDENNYLEDMPVNQVWAKGQREKIDKQIRKSIYENMQDKISHEIDKRSAVDTRRVVPIVGSLNAFTGRIVTEVSAQSLINKDLIRLQESFQLKNWNH